MQKHRRPPKLADWQPPAGRRTAPFELRKLDPGATPWSCGDKDVDRAAIADLALEVAGLQNLFYADGRRAMLVVLQGTDAAGKDSTIRSVFGRTSPLGVHSVGWKVPNDEESSHDYLWRIHNAMPRRREITVFNRSHYEEVLVPVVNRTITAAETALRYRQINDFERMLTENGTVILKFMLHISYDEQRERLQERVDDPAKRWKFSMGDLDVRKQWKDYQ